MRHFRCSKQSRRSFHPGPRRRAGASAPASPPTRRLKPALYAEMKNALAARGETTQVPRLVGWLFAKLPTHLAELNDVPLRVDPIANYGTVE